MLVIHPTADFDDWLRRLADERAKARITQRIERLRQGNPGDCKSVGGGVWEMRVDFGPGYRIYFKYRGQEIVILLCGGDKRTQRWDVRRAQDLAEEDDA